MVWLCIVAGITGLEFFLKTYMDRTLPENQGEESWKRGKSFACLRKFHNTGSAGNFMCRHPEGIKCLHGLVLLAVFAKLFQEKKPLTKTGLALLAGGGLSNFTDRLRQSYVMDYISFSFGPAWFRHLVFNVADFCVFAGILLGAAGKLGE